MGPYEEMKQSPHHEGSPDRPLIVLAEAPGRNEVRFRQPLIGPSGEVFNECLRVAGLSRYQCYILNVWPYQVEKDKAGSIFNPATDEMLFHSKHGITDYGIAEARETIRLLQKAEADTVLTMGQPALSLAVSSEAASLWANVALSLLFILLLRCTARISGAT